MSPQHPNPVRYTFMIFIIIIGQQSSWKGSLTFYEPKSWNRQSTHYFSFLFRKSKWYLKLNTCLHRIGGFQLNVYILPQNIKYFPPSQVNIVISCHKMKKKKKHFPTLISTLLTSSSVVVIQNSTSSEPNPTPLPLLAPSNIFIHNS